MPSETKVSRLLLFGALAAVACGVQAAEMLTLFTTPQERQLINANRYKTDEVRPAPVEDDHDEPVIQSLVREMVTRSYAISGITISPEGAHSVWINSTRYEDGDSLDDRSQVRIVVGDEIRVRITAPDGKSYYAASGETLEVSYMAAVEN